MQPTDNGVEELIRELAKKHHVLLGKDDPLALFATLQLSLLRKLQEEHQQHLEVLKSAVELAVSTWSEDSRDRAQKIVNGALEASKKTFSANADAFSASIDLVFSKRLDELRQLAAEVRAENKTSHLVVACCSGVSLVLGAGALLIAAFGH